MKIKELAQFGDLTEKEIKERKWRHPRIFKKGCSIVFKYYAISRDGLVIRISPPLKWSMAYTGQLLSKYVQNGYVHVNLKSPEVGIRQRKIRFHRLLWETFVGEIPEGLQINHKDLNKENNLLSNLELMSPGENTRHAHKNGIGRDGINFCNNDVGQRGVIHGTT